jgi:pimeloyl-ACP methyl ester carboxylesterase
MLRKAIHGSLLACVLMLGGCFATGPDNPRFAISDADLRADWNRMLSEHTAIERPVVLVGSYRGPDPIVSTLERRFESLTTGDRDDVLRIPTWFDIEMETVIDRTVRMTAERFGLNAEGTETVEVDVIGLSMGGVVARAAAIAEDGRPRLKIRRLFTIASPHRGADLATRVAIDPEAKAMQPGSAFLKRLDEAYGERDYELVPYGVLNDGIVHVVNTAPPDEVPIWTRGKFFGSHLTVNDNRRIIADIARRLRGEEPIASRGEPLPDFH